VNAVSTAETCSRGIKFVQYLDCVSGVTKSWRRALCECSKYGRNMQQRDKIFFVYLKGEFGGVTNVQSSYNKTNETH